MSFAFRKLNRARNWDYSSNGKYFVTLCVKDKCISFGKVINKKLVLNKFGVLVRECWLKIPNYYKNIKLDEFIVMPDHLHGIIEIYGLVKKEKVDRSKMYLSKAIRGFKVSMSKLINKRIWKESYWDKIIRDEEALKVIRKYIRDNSVNFKNSLQER